MVFNQARFGQLSPRKEVPNLIPDNPNLRPADIFIHSFVGGNDTALDVTVVSPMSVNLLDKEAREPGASLEFRYKEKVQKYHQLLHGQNIKFSPLVITTLGGWHTASVDILYRLSEAVAKQGGGGRTWVTCRGSSWADWLSPSSLAMPHCSSLASPFTFLSGRHSLFF